MRRNTGMGHDVLAFGEALIRLQPEGDTRIEDAARFLAHPGGAELNTCHALASLGLRAAYFSLLPEGPLGRRILRHARGAGVDVTLVRTAPGRLGTYWVECGREPRTTDVLYATLTGRGERALDYGLALAALKHSLPGDTLATTPEELERIVAREVRDIRR